MYTRFYFIALAVFIGCANGESHSNANSGAQTQQQATDWSKGKQLSEVKQANIEGSVTTLALCDALAPQIGLLPMTWKNSVDHWTAAGLFKVDSLVETHILPDDPVAAGFIPVTTAKLSVVEGLSTDAAQVTTVRLWPCGEDNGCYFHLKVGEEYVMLLHKHGDQPVKGYSIPTTPYVTLVAQGVFAQKADSGWTNGNIGSTTKISLAALKVEMSKCMAQVQQTGQCTSSLAPDIAAPTSGATDNPQGEQPTPGGSNVKSDAGAATSQPTVEADAESHDTK